MFQWISLFLLFFLPITTHAEIMTLSIKAFASGVTMPVIYTCDGKDISPDLKWSNLTEKTKSMAIVLSDEDAPGGQFYHWVIFNIPTKTSELVEAASLPDGAIIGKNTWGKSQY